jgi:hypothetical protein
MDKTMKTWRPEGWDESAEATARKCADDERFRNADFVNALKGMFEAGADAMLYVLKKKGAWMTPEQMKLLAPDRKYPYGYLVFIPEEKE